MSGISLSKDNGVNPTMNVCHYCRKPKSILLPGAAGDNIARKHGIPSGKMPREILVEGDIEPCDECSEKGIAIVEVEGTEEEFTYTRNRWLVTEEFIKKLLVPGDILEDVLKKRVVLMPSEVVATVGLGEVAK